jgi:hypothetical protein
MPHALSSDAMTAGSVTIAGDGGDQIAAYLARPDASQPRGGVVVIHHMPGYDRATRKSPGGSPNWGTTPSARTCIGGMRRAPRRTTPRPPPEPTAGSRIPG